MRRISLLLVAVVGLSAFASPLFARPPGTENYNKSGNPPAEGCGDDNSLLIHAPTNLWPPNHKYYTDIYALATDEDGGTITLNTRGSHDQYDGDVEENGAGNTGDDITANDEDVSPTYTPGDEDSDPEVVAEEIGDGSVQTDWQARAERSGRFKEGRTYTLTALATFDDGECDVPVTFLVPHDMRKSNRDGGLTVPAVLR